MGQGLFQRVAQVASDRFGVSLGREEITASDTGKVPNMPARSACNKIRSRIAEEVAGKLQAEPAGIVLGHSMVQMGATSMTVVDNA